MGSIILVENDEGEKMAIKTSIFGGVVLTGKAVQAFQEQFLQPNQKQNVAAQDSLRKGRAILKELKSKGRTVIKSKKRD